MNRIRTPPSPPLSPSPPPDATRATGMKGVAQLSKLRPTSANMGIRTAWDCNISGHSDTHIWTQRDGRTEKLHFNTAPYHVVQLEKARYSRPSSQHTGSSWQPITHSYRQCSFNSRCKPLLCKTDFIDAKKKTYSLLCHLSYSLGLN